MPTQIHQSPQRLKTLFRALTHRNYRLFFTGHGISLIGTWMQRVALGWLVYRVTDSAFLLGLVGFAGQIPAFLFAPIAGVLADRWNKRHLLLLTQTSAMLQATLLTGLVLADLVRIWHIIALSFFLGIIHAFDMPIRQSFVVELIGNKNDLGNAIALNSSMVNGARLLGPSIAGILIAAAGEGTCFLINAISYLPIIAALSMMRIAPRQSASRNGKIWDGLKEGFTYASGFEPIRTILLLIGLVSLMGMPYIVLMPVFARDILLGGPHTLGFLMGSVGVGALAGAVYLASRSTVLGLERIIPVAAALLGVSLIVFSFSSLLWLSLILMLTTGFGQMVQMASSNTILQTIVDDDKRGRIMSFYTLAFMGIAPIGSLAAGYAASQIGASWTISIGGMACILGASLFAGRLSSIRTQVRPIYVTMGILPEIARGMQRAVEPSAHPKTIN
ncbi:MFS transporter [bacterium]|nr:MFS transporter [candidate division CSSED10-310 bacterium]